MIKTSVVVKADPGFDGRPIALLVQEASQYASKVYIQVAEKNINAKSIMGMMSLNLIGGRGDYRCDRRRGRAESQLKALRHFLLTYNNNKMVIEVTER